MPELPRELRFCVRLVSALLLSAALLPGQSAEAAEGHAARGASLLHAGNPRQARDELLAAIRLNPRLVQARVMLGVAETQLGNYSDAVAALREALRLDPGSESAHYNLALALTRLNKTDDAVAELERVVQLNPRFSAARYNLGLLLIQKNRFREAIEHLEAAGTERPNDAAISLLLVHAYLKADRAARALQLAAKAIQGDTDGKISARLGVMLEQSGHHQEAASALEKARGFFPDSLELITSLARAYLGANRAKDAVALLVPARERQPAWQISYLLGLAYTELSPADAAALLREAVRLRPDEAQPHYSLGSLLLKSQEPAEQQAGADEIRKAIGRAPDQADYYSALGKWLLERSKLDAATALLKQAIDKAKQPTAEIYVMLGIGEAELHGAESARPFVEKALELDPRLGQAHYVLGHLYFRGGDYRQAAKYFKQAAALNPQSDLYAHNVAVALERLNQVAEAVPFAERCVQLKPRQSLYHYTLGKLYGKAGKNAESLRELEKAVELDPKIDYPYYLLARAYSRLGNPAKAREWSRKLEELKQSRDRVAGLSGSATDSRGLLEPAYLTSSPRE